MVLDFGGMFQGYAVDLTRTLVIGTATERQQRLLEDVSEAQAAGLCCLPGSAHASE